jgi:hypothetical protein
MIQPITDHYKQALDKLIQRYKGKPIFAAMLKSYLRQVQDLEDATVAVSASRDVDTADETRLEVIGRIVGQPPSGASLETYRLYVKVRILVNRSDGSPETVKKIARTLLGQGTTLHESSMAMSLAVKGPIDLGVIDPDVVFELLDEAHSAGIKFSFEFFPEAANTMFHFVPGVAPVADGRGFSKLDGTLGGVFSRVRST